MSRSQLNSTSVSFRARGIREHLERAQLLLRLGRSEMDRQSKYRLMLASIYSCRAISELMLEAAEKQEVKKLCDPDPKVNRASLEELLARKLPYYQLIERIRIHDFHRFGIVAPNPAFVELTYGGPVKLTAQRGVATVSAAASGAQFHTTGASSVKPQRALLIRDGDFFDEESSRFVTLDELLDAFLSAAPHAIGDFEQLIAS